MIGAVIILLVTLAVGLVLYVYDLKWRRAHKADGADGAGAPDDAQGAEEPSAPEGHGSICCGKHLVCEKSLSPQPGEKAEYYDDEELDRFAGRPSDQYADTETDEFRDVMLTMQPSDLPGWARSLQLRRIEMPQALRDEFFLLLEDA